LAQSAHNMHTDLPKWNEQYLHYMQIKRINIDGKLIQHCLVTRSSIEYIQ